MRIGNGESHTCILRKMIPWNPDTDFQYMPDLRHLNTRIYFLTYEYPPRICPHSQVKELVAWPLYRLSALCAPCP